MLSGGVDHSGNDHTHKFSIVSGDSIEQSVAAAVAESAVAESAVAQSAVAQSAVAESAIAQSASPK